ncbi:MAG: adenylate/guanylate cyclase domain-containing protein [Candidatus Kapaibacterium sp.]|nr:tetratricopeptide repeat protein [Bacteroidota bacterium]
MNQIVIMDTVREAENLLNDARSFYMRSELHDSERCTLEALALLKPYEDMDDIGESTDEASVKHAVIESIAHVYNRLNTIYDARGDYHKAIEYGKTAIEYCEKGNIRTRAGNLYGNLGGNYANIGDYTKGLEYLHVALTVAEENNDLKLIATWLGNISVVYKFIGDLHGALEILSRVQQISTQLLDAELEANNQLAIGQIYFELENHTLALEYYLNALNHFKTLDLKQDVAIVLINIGILYDVKGEYETALQYMKESLSINEKISSKAFVANCLCNIGDVYIRTGDYLQAIAYLKRSLAQAEELDDKRQQAHSVYGLGVAASKLGKDSWKEGEEYLRKAIHDAVELGLIHLEARCRKSLSDALAEQLRWEESAMEFRKYHDLERKVQSEAATLQAQQIENRRKVDEAERDRQVKIAQHKVTVQLLHKTLPPSIAQRLMDGEHNIADKYDSASILFADIVGFTPISARTEPRKMVELLNNLFTRFDKLTLDCKVERIKTIGDAYMVVAGVPEACEDHALRIARFAVAIEEEAKQFSDDYNEPIQFRVGINTGEVVAAVVGESKFAYDVWGDSVNTASRMESHGEAGKIHCSEEFMKALGNSSFHFIERGEMDIKGKGTMKTYFLERADGNG